MSILSLLLWLAFIGLVAWLLIRFVPMVPAMRSVIVVAAVIIGILLIANATGIFHALNSPQVPRVK